LEAKGGDNVDEACHSPLCHHDCCCLKFHPQKKVKEALSLKTRKITTVTLLLLAVFSVLPAFQVDFIPFARASTLPTDADAWTENDNATYPWYAHPDHNTETMSFTTSDKYVGSYAFNITHTDPWTRMRWFLNFSVTDLSSFEALEFWIKPLWLGAVKSIMVYVEGTTFQGSPNYYVKFKATNSSWSKVYVPLSAFLETGSPSWTDRCLLDFYVSDNIGASDGTTVLLDGINFKTHTDASPTNTLDKTWFSNFYYPLPQYRESSPIVYEGNSYTTLIEWNNVTNGADITGNLEAESIGQTVGALCYLYKETPAPSYLAKARLYADWIIQWQSLAGMGDGLVQDYNNATSTFDDTIRTTHNGWVLWGVSVLYNITENSTYKTFCDNLMDCLVSDTWLWNSTVKMWDLQYDNVTGWTYASSCVWSMASASCMAGLGSYYRYVDQNSTVKTVIETFYGNVVEDSNNAFKKGSDTEQTMYASWGLYECWQAFSNTTYKNEVINRISEFYHAYSEINSNASINKYNHYCKTDSWSFLDGWGLQCGLPLLMVDYETESTTFKQKAYEKVVFDYISLAKGDAWLMEYDINNVADPDRAWSAGSLFISLSLLKYMKRFVNEPYILASDAKVTSMSVGSEGLTFVVDGSGTSTTEVYCDGKGEPKSVTGGELTDYNSQVATIQVDHNSESTVTVIWGGKASGKFKLTVHVKKDGLPSPFVPVSVSGVNGSVKTGLFGSASFMVTTGTYLVNVTVDDQTKNKTVTVHRDVSVGFEFETVQAPPSHIGEAILVIGVVCVVAFFIYPMFLRRRR